jgi:hypothetical protein
MNSIGWIAYMVEGQILFEMDGVSLAIGQKLPMLQFGLKGCSPNLAWKVETPIWLERL